MERRARILIVDDSRVNLRVARVHLESEGYLVDEARDGDEALRAVSISPPDLILLDIMMPGIDGYEVCRRLKKDEDTRLIPIIMLTALDSLEDKVKALDQGADDFISKPFNRVELLARVRSLVRVKWLNERLEKAENVLYTLAKAIEAKDGTTEAHTERVGESARMLGERLGLSLDDQEDLRKGGILHDVGKIGIREAILLKPDSLTPTEYAEMKKHCEIGSHICSTLRISQGLRSIIRSHHERYDGTGYPDGLKGDEIPLLPRILAIADAYDAMTNDRPYRKALPKETAIKRLQEAAGKQFDPNLVRIFVQVITEGQGSIQSFEEMSA
ncbi:MAG: response regulator [Armatimonadetes bacterium]|nr:response regulator [Armatimonadota bacterium]